MESLRQGFGTGGAGMSLVRHQPHVPHHPGVKDWLRRLAWRAQWLVAQRSMRVWLADQTFTERQLRPASADGRLVEEPGVAWDGHRYDSPAPADPGHGRS